MSPDTLNQNETPVERPKLSGLTYFLTLTASDRPSPVLEFRAMKPYPKARNAKATDPEQWQSIGWRGVKRAISDLAVITGIEDKERLAMKAITAESSAIAKSLERRGQSALDFITKSYDLLSSIAPDSIDPVSGAVMTLVTSFRKGDEIPKTGEECKAKILDIVNGFSAAELFRLVSGFDRKLANGFAGDEIKWSKERKASEKGEADSEDMFED